MGLLRFLRGPKIRHMYTFVAYSHFLLGDKFTKLEMQNLLPGAFQTIRRSNSEFDRLCYRVDANTPDTFGAAEVREMPSLFGDPGAHIESHAGHEEVFQRWRKSQGVDPTSDLVRLAASTGKRDFRLGEWTVFVCIELYP